jgi:ubiquinone/menaquinone biosynthesis C-methylase UbiE
MLKLNLGCSVVKETGYINVDNHIQADLKHDLLEPLPYKDDSVDEILASHVLEHFSYTECDEVLKDWCRVLKKDGILHIRVPDMEAICKDYLLSDQERKDNWCVIEFYGGQWNGGEFHKNGFNYESLKNKVESHGFRVLERIAPRNKIKTFPRFPGDHIILELNIKFIKV